MLRLSHGLLPRPAMQCFFVRWSKGKLLGGRIAKKLIEFDVLMRRDMLLQIQIKVIKVKIKTKLLVKCCLVYTSTKIHVFRKIPTKQEGSYIGTYAQLVFRLREKLILTHRQIVENPNQKTSNHGHAIQMVCP